MKKSREPLVQMVLRTAKNQNKVMLKKSSKNSIGENIADLLEEGGSSHVASYLESLIDLDSQKAAEYVQLIKSDFKGLWKTLLIASKCLDTGCEDLSVTPIDKDKEPLVGEDDQEDEDESFSNLVEDDQDEEDEENEPEVESSDDEGEEEDFSNDEGDEEDLDSSDEFSVEEDEEEVPEVESSDDEGEEEDFSNDEVDENDEDFGNEEDLDSSDEDEDLEVEGAAQEKDEKNPLPQPPSMMGEPGENQVAIEPVVTPQQILEAAASADFDLVLFNENSDNPHYAVFANGKPVAEIALEDQPRAAEIADMFVSDEYAQTVKESLATFDNPLETLQSLNAKFYHAVVNTGEIAQRAASIAESHLEDEYAARLAALKEDFFNTMILTLQASNKGTKGLFVSNTLKQAMRQAMRQAGVENPVPIVDKVWEKYAPQYFNEIIATTEKWMGYNAETLQEMTKEILGGANFEQDEEDTEKQDSLVSANYRARQMGISNVPVRTGGFVPQGDLTEQDERQANYKAVKNLLTKRISPFSRHR